MTVFAAALLAAAVCLAQAPTKKPMTFHGKVEAVDTSAKSVKVNDEKVEGWMMAMTMDYKVDSPSILTTLKARDQIMATVYCGFRQGPFDGFSTRRRDGGSVHGSGSSSSATLKRTPSRSPCFCASRINRPA